MTPGTFLSLELLVIMFICPPHYSVYVGGSGPVRYTSERVTLARGGPHWNLL